MSNLHDPFAVAILKDDDKVAYVPQRIFIMLWLLSWLLFNHPATAVLNR